MAPTIVDAPARETAGDVVTSELAALLARVWPRLRPGCARRLGVARALHSELPATARLLRDGRISTYAAGLVVSETRHLHPQQRQAVAPQLAGQPATPLADCAPRPAAMLARRHAYHPTPCPSSPGSSP